MTEIERKVVKRVAVPKNERNGSNIQKMYQFIPWNMSFHARYNSWRGIIKLPTDIRVWILIQALFNNSTLHHCRASPNSPHSRQCPSAYFSVLPKGLLHLSSGLGNFLTSLWSPAKEQCPKARLILTRHSWPPVEVLLLGQWTYGKPVRTPNQRVRVDEGTSKRILL